MDCRDLSRVCGYIKRMGPLTPNWTKISDSRERIRSWYSWHRARLARAAQIDALGVDLDRFLNWVLDPGNIAQRPPPTGKHQSQPMQGRHINRGSPADMRGSDLGERVWVCVRILELKGFTNKVACVRVAEALDWKWSAGKSKRGRPRRARDERNYFDNVQTVRSLANKYRFLSGMRPSDQLVKNYVGLFLHFEDWLESIRPVLETPIGKLGYERVLGAGYLEKFLTLQNPERQGDDANADEEVKAD